ncbi:MAG TPA: 30S ribosomal protein S12 methylthiotransferase RimO [Planctomycetota bacterium]|nr:30S ribosomal protein S12 methylthiotransferase RimO [Planctomycetota bacterium]
MTSATRVSLVHLGCPKNQIDSEVLLGRLASDGMLVCGRPEDAEIAVVNTCAFIGPAREESLGAIRGLLDRKRAGALRGVVVAGCLPQQFRAEVEADPSLRDVDAFLGLGDSTGIAEVVRAIVDGRGARALTGGGVRGVPDDTVRLLTGPRSYAYLRISEGCDHDCAFCIIPRIRGRHRSKPLATLASEAAALAEQGAREVVLVAEDATWYGRDLPVATGYGRDLPVATGYGRDTDGRERLPDAIATIADAPGVRWVRTMYAYPNGLPAGLTDVLRDHPRVVEYLDIPIQHIASGVLKAMRRASSGAKVRETLARLREEVPGIALRTTIIVGFPGETEADFGELLDFLREFRFERLGAFRFSLEKGTPSYDLPGRVPEDEIARRHDAVLRLQRDVVRERNRSLVGAEVEVLVDGRDRKGSFVGRTRADAPEIDCSVKLRGSARPGDVLRGTVRGVAGDGYDLVVEPAGGAC